MAILLHEEGLKKRAQVYATDFNELILEKARQGVYSLEAIKLFTSNYQKAGGKASFADYYSAHYDHAIFKNFLRERILFSEHNLATDGVFGEMHLICCRNVLIYFDRKLQSRVVKLFLDSLCPGGFLCLGAKESLKLSDYEDCFDTVSAEQKIYRKKLGLSGDALENS